MKYQKRCIARARQVTRAVFPVERPFGMPTRTHATDANQRSFTRSRGTQNAPGAARVYETPKQPPAPWVYQTRTVDADRKMFRPSDSLTEQMDPTTVTSKRDADRLSHFGLPVNTDPSFNMDGSNSRVANMFPEAWGGPYRRNHFLEKIIIYDVASNPDFMLREIMPIRAEEEGGPTYEVTEVQFENSMLDDVAELGVMRWVEHNTRSWQVESRRRALGFFMEDGFLMTDKGKRDYNYSIKQISNGLMMCLERDAWLAILSAAPQEPEREAARFMNMTKERHQDNEISLFGALSKLQHGMQVVVQHARRVAAHRMTTFSGVILPHGMLGRVGSGDFFKETAKGGDATGLSRPEASAMRYIPADMKVYEAGLYPIGGKGRHGVECPLTRRRVIGTFWIFPSVCDSIRIKDFATDRMTEITRVDVNKALGGGSTNGKDVLLVRLQEQWDMDSTVFVRVGEVGFSAVTRPNFTLSHDGQRKSLTGSFTVYTAAVVTHPENVLVVPDVAYRQYISGGNAKIVPKDDIANYYNEHDVVDSTKETADVIACVLDEPEALELRARRVLDMRNADSAKLANVHALAQLLGLATGIQESAAFTGSVSADAWKGGLLTRGFCVTTTPHGNKYKTVGMGHHGPYTYDGCTADREGRGTRQIVDSSPREYESVSTSWPKKDPEPQAQLAHVVRQQEDVVVQKPDGSDAE
jgi:hypothetical protein